MFQNGKYIFILSLKIPAYKIYIIHKDHNILLYSFIFITKNIKTLK